MKKWSSQWTQFMQLRKEAWKKIQDFNGVWTRDLAITGAMLYQLSYEATDVGSRSIVKEMSVNGIWNKSYMNCGNCVHCDDHFFIFISFPQFIYDLFHILLALISFTGTFEPTIDLLPTSVAS